MSPAAPASTAKHRFRRPDPALLQLLLLIALIFAAMSALDPHKFLRPYVFESITFVAPELGLLSIAMMLAMLTGGPAIVGYPALWGAIGNGELFGVAVPLLVFLGAALLVALMLARTPFGISLKLIGTSARAARFAGLRNARAVFGSYVLSGVLASAAGIILSGRTNASKSDYGVSYLLQAVLIAVLGGTNPAGGRGSVFGIVLALLALMLLSSGLQLMRFSNFLVDFIWGAFLLLSIALNALRTRSR